MSHYHFVPRQELLKCIYPQADVLVLPSKAEGFGLVLLEAMSLGMCVIAANAWAMPEIVKHGINGFLIQPGSVAELTGCMMQLAGQPALLCAMCERAKIEFQGHFSVQAHNQRLREVYERVLLG